MENDAIFEVMRTIIASFCLFGFLSSASAQEFHLDDFLTSNSELDKAVDSVFESLNNSSRVAQVLMPAVGRLGTTPDTIDMLIREQRIGGVLMLNGTMDQFSSWTTQFEKLNRSSGNLPFLYSADAEPSLVNRKIQGSRVVPSAVEIKSMDQLIQTATTISEDLNVLGINYNFAPVVDVSVNKTVGYRGFGSTPENILPYSETFIQTTQDHNIVATAKHFPGHGLISGDTHKSLQVIDGELKELKNYPPLIEKGVLSVMVAHIAIKNNPEFNTNGLPATISENIVTGLLRDSLGFQGLIVTDAMNMGGVIKVPDAASKAIEAGCDIVLMPLNVFKTHADLLKKYEEEQVFQDKVNLAVKRIIRMKICLGLLDSQQQL